MNEQKAKRASLDVKWNPQLMEVDGRQIILKN